MEECATLLVSAPALAAGKEADVREVRHSEHAQLELIQSSTDACFGLHIRGIYLCCEAAVELHVYTYLCGCEAASEVISQQTVCSTNIYV